MPKLTTNKINLSKHQQGVYDLIVSALDDNDLFLCLSGFAGTGKTVMIGEIVKHLVKKRKLDVCVAAPTNKALRVLEGRVNSDVDFLTIHKLLGLGLIDELGGGQVSARVRRAPIDNYQFVVIDESSMISQEQFITIAKEAKLTNTRILFVGDRAQLPPINDNNISPVFTHVQKQFVLNDIVRQRAGNPIIELSMLIRRNIETGTRTTFNDLMQFNGSSVQIVSGGDASIRDWAVHEIESGRDCRVIGYTNKYVLTINRAVHDIVMDDPSELPFLDGDRIVFNKPYNKAWSQDKNGRESIHTNEEFVVCDEHCRDNDVRDVRCYIVGLRKDNGSVLYVTIPFDPYALYEKIITLFERAKEEKQKGNNELATSLNKHAWYLKNNIGEVRHAYALTAHKSQGSTFDTTIVSFNDLNKMQNTHEFNTALYVAVTRSSEHLAIVV